MLHYPKLLSSLSFYHTVMNPLQTRFLITLALIVIIIAPASALYKLDDVQVTPAAESLPSGTLVNTTAMIEIIPPGPTTTFVEWDNLVLSTELSDPRWNVVVLVDDRQVVMNPEEGPVMNVPGYLLSYPVNKQVAVAVQLDGQVPPSQDQRPFTVLRVEELNDRGETVGGPAEVVTRIIAPPATPLQPLPTTQGAMQPPATPTKAGVSLVPVIAGLLASLAVLGRMKD
jgi:hypothetical protein